MIRDCLQNYRFYLSLNPSFKKAFEFLERRDLGDMTEGKYDLDERGAFAIVQDYRTKEQWAGVIESHRRYIDIQYVVRGAERIGIAFRESCRAGEYDEERDFQRLDGPAEFIALTAGCFAVFMPHDGHMPGLQLGNGPEDVRKVVVKVPAA